LEREKLQEKQLANEKSFQPPKEPNRRSVDASRSQDTDVKASVQNIKQRGTKRKASSTGDVSDYVVTAKKQRTDPKE